MELTFLKLACVLVRRSREKEREREAEGRRSGQEKRRSKKDRSAGASRVDGDNGSLGIALSIFGPLGPSALPPRPTGTTLDSIPFHSTPFPPLDYPGNSRGTVPLFSRRGKPPSNTALPKLPLPRKPCPHFLGA